MTLTAKQIALIQDSFKSVEPIADTAAEIFYAKLFEYDPALKHLFKGHMKSQGRKLMQMLKAAVNGLNDLDRLVPVIQQLAERHVNYGVEVEDYTPVGNALIYTLKQGLGDEFTFETRQAWIDLYKLVANVMRQHAYKDFDSKSFINQKRYQR